MVSENNRRIAKNTLMLYIRMILIMLVTLYTSRVVLRALGVTDYGIYNVVGGVVTMLGFLNGAMTTATQRYLTFELGRKDMERLKKVFCMSLLIHGLISLIVVLLSETAGLWLLYSKMSIPPERFSAALWVFHSAVLSCVVLMMSVPYNALIVAYERMSAFAYISILEAVLKLAIVFLLQAGDMDRLKLYAVLMLAVQLVIRVLYGIYCRCHFKELRFRLMWDRPLFTEMVSFAGWSVYGSVSYMCYTQGLNVLLNMFFNPVVNAARGIAVQVQAAIQTFSTNFQMALNPQITKSYAAGELQRMHSLVFASSKYSFLLLLLFSYPIWLETGTVLRLWLGTVPDYTVDFIRIILGISMIDVLSGSFVVSAQATGRVRKYQFWVGNSLLLTVLAAYVGLKCGCSPQDVFWIQLVMIALTLGVRFCIVRPMIGLPAGDFVCKVLGRVLLVSLLSFPLPWLVHNSGVGNSLMRLVLVCVSSVVSVGLFSYLAGMNGAERAFTRERLQGIRNRLRRR